MCKEEEISVDFGNGKSKIFKYSLSNNINDIIEAVHKRTGCDTIDLDKIQWEENTGLSESVKTLMNNNNVNYSMTKEVDGYMTHVWINKRSDEKWFLYSGNFVKGKFIPDMLSIPDNVAVLIMSYLECSAILKEEGYSPTPLFNEDNECLSFIDQGDEYRIIIRGDDLKFVTLYYTGQWTCNTNDEMFLLYKNASLVNYNTTVGKICIFLSDKKGIMHIYVAVDTTLSEFKDHTEQCKTMIGIIQDLRNKFIEYMNRDIE
jgi:hypothetical protein